MPTNSELKNIRASLGWTQEQAVEYVGVSQGAISSWETGKMPTPPHALELLREAKSQDAIPEIDIPTFGEWVKTTRKSNSLSVQDLAEKAMLRHLLSMP